MLTPEFKSDLSKDFLRFGFLSFDIIVASIPLYAQIMKSRVLNLVNIKLHGGGGGVLWGLYQNKSAYFTRSGLMVLWSKVPFIR